MPSAQHLFARQLKASAKAATAHIVPASVAKTPLSTLTKFSTPKFSQALVRSSTTLSKNPSVSFREEQGSLLVGFWACSMLGIGSLYAIALMSEESNSSEEKESGAEVYRPWV